MTEQEAIKILISKINTANDVLKAKEEKPEEKTAYWAWNKKRYMYVCSECGENPTEGTGYNHDLKRLNFDFKYCRNCGARIITEDHKINVGDEIKSQGGTFAIVTNIDAKKRLCCLKTNGVAFFINENCYNNYWKKTGKHYNKLDKLLKDMKKTTEEQEKKA